MSYSSNPANKIVCLFESATGPINEVNGQHFSIVGGVPTLEDSPHGKGMRLSSSYYLSTNPTLSITNGFSIGFFLKPVHAGLYDTGSAFAPVRQSLLSKANYSFISNVMTALATSFQVYEESQPGGMNKMVVQIVGGTTGTVTSASYTVGEWHHFWITYNGTLSASSRVSILIDGGASTNTISGTVPTSMTTVAYPVEVNRAVTGPVEQVTRNTGVIDDLIVLNTNTLSITDVSRIVNLGPEWALDPDYTSIRETYLGIGASDPATIEVNGVVEHSDGVLVGRSDGTVSQSSRSVWQHRRTFGTSAEQALLAKKYGALVELGSGTIKPTTMIRV